MLDYQAIAALAMVIETQSFQSAAERLFITQSAVSQRIKSLERYYGKPVMVRTLPFTLTELGLTLVGHFKRIMILEDALKGNLTEEAIPPKISISISRDMLETWFQTILKKLKNVMPLTLDIIADDQDLTWQYLKKGIVSACASTMKKPISGGKSVFMGYFDYILVASPEFKKRYFYHSTISKSELLDAPTVLFDKNDKLNAAYMKKYFNMEHENLHNYHIIPSVAGFKQFALNGYAYALIPYIDIIEELKKKKLINLFPEKIWHMPVYWHSFEIETPAYCKFNEFVIAEAKKLLNG